MPRLSNTENAQTYGTMSSANEVHSTEGNRLLKLLFGHWEIRYPIYAYLCNSDEKEPNIVSIDKQKPSTASIEDSTNRDKALINWIHSMRLPKHEVQENTSTINVVVPTPEKIPPSLLNLMLTSKQLFASIINDHHDPEETIKNIPLVLRFYKTNDNRLEYYTLGSNKKNSNWCIAHLLSDKKNIGLPLILEKIFKESEQLPQDFSDLVGFKKRAKIIGFLFLLSIGLGLLTYFLMQMFSKAINTDTLFLFSGCPSSTDDKVKNMEQHKDGFSYLQDNCHAQSTCSSIFQNTTSFIQASGVNESIAANFTRFLQSYCQFNTGYCRKKSKPIMGVTPLHFGSQTAFVDCGNSAYTLTMILFASWSFSLLCIGCTSFWTARTVKAFWNPNLARRFDETTRITTVDDETRDLFFQFHNHKSLPAKATEESETSSSSPLLSVQ
jgi:hypothetical protein